LARFDIASQLDKCTVENPDMLTAPPSVVAVFRSIAQPVALMKPVSDALNAPPSPAVLPTSAQLAIVSEECPVTRSAPPADLAEFALIVL
jgi:hypothetical protein